MRIHALINYSIVDLGTIQTWADNKGHTITTTNVYENQQFPDLDQFDLLIILGGLMSAYEEEKHPWIKMEKQFIKKAIDAGKGVLGVCLGAQMIADTIGSKTYPQGHLELGWWDVQFTESIKDIPVFKGLPTDLKLFQFHSDTYQLPPDATHLAKSKGCENQAFIYGDRVVGLQFHPEFTEAKIQEMVDLIEAEMADGPYAQHPEEFLGREDDLQKAQAFLFTLLDNLEKEIIKPSTHALKI